MDGPMSAALGGCCADRLCTHPKHHGCTDVQTDCASLQGLEVEWMSTCKTAASSDWDRGVRAAYTGCLSHPVQHHQTPSLQVRGKKNKKTNKKSH